MNQPPRTPTPPAETTFECIACTEKYGFADLVVIDNSPVCRACVTKIFQDAIDNEINYPPKWGGTRLRPSQFREVLTSDFRRAFRYKEREYRIPPDERIYCANRHTYYTDDYIDDEAGTDADVCGAFIGQLTGSMEPRDILAIDAYLHQTCAKCGVATCLMCGEVCEATCDEHNCKAPSKAQEEAAAFKNLVRGKDYQICPSKRCKRKVELRDGCNDVICTCGQRFCYVCGEEVKSTQHWQKAREDGGCPRFNHPSMQNATWEQEADGMPGFQLRPQVAWEDWQELAIARMLRREAEQAENGANHEDDAPPETPRLRPQPETSTWLTPRPRPETGSWLTGPPRSLERRNAIAGLPPAQTHTDGQDRNFEVRRRAAARRHEAEGILRNAALTREAFRVNDEPQGRRHEEPEEHTVGRSGEVDTALNALRDRRQRSLQAARDDIARAFEERAQRQRLAIGERGAGNVRDQDSLTASPSAEPTGRARTSGQIQHRRRPAVEIERSLGETIRRRVNAEDRPSMSLEGPHHRRPVRRPAVEIRPEDVMAIPGAQIRRFPAPQMLDTVAGASSEEMEEE